MDEGYGGLALRLIRYTVHALLFLLAAVAFVIGLALGLQVNPTLGTVLWAAALLVLALNVYWMTRGLGSEE